jgi:hypothetical protein
MAGDGPATPSFKGIQTRRHLPQEVLAADRHGGCPAVNPVVSPPTAGLT